MPLSRSGSCGGPNCAVARYCVVPATVPTGPLLLLGPPRSPFIRCFRPKRRAALCVRYGLEDGHALEQAGATTRAAASVCVQGAFARTLARARCQTLDADSVVRSARLRDGAQKELDHLLDREGEYPSLRKMARTLHMSERTLNRKLKAQGTSHQMLLDDVRQELAVWYLRQTDMSVEAIAERLGYRDTSNFSRACKRWCGVTSRAIRGS